MLKIGDSLFEMNKKFPECDDISDEQPKNMTPEERLESRERIERYRNGLKKGNAGTSAKKYALSEKFKHSR